MKYKTKSLLVTRLPRKGSNEFKTASIKLFKINDPHKTTELPTKMLEYENIEKIVLKNLEIDYYLEGNDLIINNLKEVSIEKKSKIIEIHP
jgi:hypothetical protein